MNRIITYLAVVSLLLLGFQNLNAQNGSTLRLRTFEMSDDSLALDSFLILPASVKFTTINGDTVSKDLWRIDFANSILIVNDSLVGDSFQLRYRIINVSLGKIYQNEDIIRISNPELPDNTSYLYRFDENDGRRSNELFDFGELRKNGSISRGISIGNNQDAVLSSNLNLQLSGNLGDNIEIRAAVSDNSLPIQPEGNTQQLQEFDKVFIELKSPTMMLVAGDFEIRNSGSSFVRFNKKVQGANFQSGFTTGDKDTLRWKSEVGAAIAKGKFARNAIQGSEGNQGPYKLRGNNNETFIVVLAGSERVFIDGELLKRGQSNDYVINYNSAEITFTPNRIITKDSRITVEFEYSDRNYARSLLFAKQSVASDKFSLNIQYLTEQDLKNQPINQEQLIEDNGDLLASIGDNTDLAVVPNVKEVNWNNSEVLYKLIDTIVNSTVYDSVFVYSTNPDSARYRLGFSYVGPNNGNYVQVKNAANGKVYSWVSPQGGKRQGDYEPVILLVTPKRQQMLSLNGEYKLTERTNFIGELAVSSRDVNLYSSVGDGDDAGIAFVGGIRHNRKWDKDSVPQKLNVLAIYEYVDRRFTYIERFRDVEFERDWSIDPEVLANEHRSELKMNWSKENSAAVHYAFESLSREGVSNSFRNGASGFYRKKFGEANASVSLMNSSSDFNSINFLRHQMNILGKSRYVNFGLRENGEYKTTFNSANDSLLGNSFAFQELGAFLANPDSAKARIKIEYKRRLDFLPELQQLENKIIAEEIQSELSILNSKKHRFRMNVGWRNLQYIDSAGSDESNLVGRMDYDLNLYKGSIRASTFYEFGSGLEFKKEFSYLEVPAGQGVYTWKDYNQDSIKQLNEFEIAAFQDEANYLRIFTPSNEYQKIWNMQFSQSLMLDPARVWHKKTGIRKYLAKFSNQNVVRVEQKLSDDAFVEALNPFSSQSDNPELQSLNSSIRSSLYFNRTHPKFGFELSYLGNSNKILLVNGFESRSQSMTNARTRWNITKIIMLKNEFQSGTKARESEFFGANNFDLTILKSINKLQFQFQNRLRFLLTYTYADKRNSELIGDEVLFMHKAGLEIKYSIPSKGSMMMRFEYVNLDYNADQNTSIAFEMLEGLRTGDNATWTLTYQRTLSNNLQLNVQYNGRKSPETKMVHVGTVQVRAFF